MSKWVKVTSLLLSIIIAFNFVFSSLSISYAAEDEAPDNTLAENGNVDYVQRVISYLFIYGIADQVKALLSLMFGNVSIDKLLFNDYDDTRLAFYPENQVNGHNKFLETPSADRGILAMINTYYGIFREIAISFYLIMLLYIGIRILMKSTARDKELFKSMLMDWLVGVIILLFFPFVIKYVIMFNEALVGLMQERIVQGKNITGGLPSTNISADQELLSALGQVEDTGEDGTDMMALYRKKALDSGNLGYAFIYFYLLLKLLSFIITYFKRLLMVIFLIVLFPFVAITYAIDKIKDQTAQIFNAWFRELLLNVYMQFFQAAIYIVVMFIINALVSSGDGNVVLTCIGIGFVSRSEGLLKSLFPSMMRGGGGGTVSPIEQVASTAVALKLAENIGKQGAAVGKRFQEAGASYKAKVNASNQNKQAQIQSDIKSLDEKLAIQRDKNFIDGARGGAAAMVGAATRNARDGVDDSAPIDAQEAQERANLDEKFKAQEDLITEVAIAQDGGAAQARIDAAMEGKSPVERAQLDAEMRTVAAIDEVVTGHSADGTLLTQQQINLAANVIIEAVQSSDPKYADVKKWMQGKTVTIERKEAVHPSIKTAKDAARWEKKHPGQKAYRTVKEKVGLDVYFGDASASPDNKDKPYFGQGLKGRVLSDRESANLTAADRLLGGRVGVSAASRIEGTFDIRTTSKNISDASRVNDQAGHGNPTFKLSSLDRERAHHQIDERDGKEKVDKMVDHYASVGGTAADREDLTVAARRIMELAEYNSRLNSTDEARKIDGVAADEMFKLTTELSTLSKRNSKVARMVADSISIRDTSGGRAAVEQTATGVRINMGTTLDGLQAASAKVVLTDKDISSTDRLAVQEDAVDVLRSITQEIQENNAQLDSIAAAVVARSELDGYLDDVQSDDSGSGITRSEKTNEEINREKYDQAVLAKKIEREKELEKLKELQKAKKQANIKAYRDSLRAVGTTLADVAGATTVLSMAVFPDGKASTKEVELGLNMGIGVAESAASGLQEITGNVSRTINGAKEKAQSSNARKAGSKTRRFGEALGSTSGVSSEDYTRNTIRELADRERKDADRKKS